MAMRTLMVVLVLASIAGSATAGQPRPRTEAEKRAEAAASPEQEAQDTAKRMEATPASRREQLRTLARQADARAQARLDDLEQRLDRRWSSLDAAGRARSRSALDAAKEAQVRFRAATRRLDADASAAWVDVRAGLVAAYRDLALATSTARREFGGTPERTDDRTDDAATDAEAAPKNPPEPLR